MKLLMALIFIFLGSGAPAFAAETSFQHWDFSGVATDAIGTLSVQMRLMSLNATSPETPTDLNATLVFNKLNTLGFSVLTIDPSKNEISGTQTVQMTPTSHTQLSLKCIGATFDRGPYDFTCEYDSTLSGNKIEMHLKGH